MWQTPLGPSGYEDTDISSASRNVQISLLERFMVLLMCHSGKFMLLLQSVIVWHIYIIDTSFSSLYGRGVRGEGRRDNNGL
ncbi:MAG: hypothetical protein CME71_11760 [Halobacteriovorax sp.]|nr:hypothetical protein [Halobacteriovorax sp.]